MERLMLVLVLWVSLASMELKGGKTTVPGKARAGRGRMGLGWESREDGGGHWGQGPMPTMSPQPQT